MRPETIVDILSQMRQGEWFGFNGKEHIYANLTILSDDEKPTEEWIEAELKRRQDEWDAKQVLDAETKASAISKLKSLGLNDAEIASIAGA